MADNLEFWADIYSRKASQGELHSKYVSIQNCFDAILQFINQFVYFVCVIPFALMHEDGNEKKTETEADVNGKHSIECYFILPTIWSIV